MTVAQTGDRRLAGIRGVARQMRQGSKSAMLRMRNMAKYGTAEIFSHVWLETITTCNRRCAYCPNSTHDRGLKRNQKLMSEALFCKVIDELAALGWTGEVAPNFYGEPLLDDRLVDWIAYVRARLPSSTVILFSNGDLLDMGRYQELLAAGVRRFMITRHGPASQPNVEEILAYREQHGGGGAAFEYGTVRDIARGRLSNRGGLVDLGTRGTKAAACDLPSRKTGIDVEGNVLICCHDYLGTAIMGNVRERRLLEVWKDPRYRKLRRDIGKGRYELELCRKCSYA